MSGPAPRPWWWWGAVVLGVVVALSVLVRVEDHHTSITDTRAVIDGTHRAIACGREGVWVACRYDPATRVSAVNPYPLLQHLPTFAFVALGAGDDLVVTLLIWVNAAAILAVIVIIAERARRWGGRPLAVAAVVATVSGMVLPYAGLSLGEPLVMLVVLAVARVGLARRSTPGLAAVATLATVGKETLFVSVVLFGIGAIALAAASGDSDRRHSARKGAWLGAGVAVGLILNAGFNVFRFGGITNVQYLIEARPGPGAALVNVVSLVLAPNGGILWFWFTAVVALAVVVAAAVVPTLVIGDTGSDRRARRWARWGSAAVAGGFLAGLVSLGFWWGPFGWYSWGPRLLLPFVPPVILTAVELIGRPVGRRARRGWVVPAGAVALVITVVLALPALAVIFAPQAWVTNIEATNLERPECAGTDSLRGPEGYGPFHECLMYEAWRPSSMPLVESVATASATAGWWFWLTAVGALVTLGWWIAIAGRSPSSPREPDDRAAPGRPPGRERSPGPDPPRAIPPGMA